MELYCGEGTLVGGYWERLIQSVKCCVKKTIGHSVLTYDELATILTEIESTLNNRPLTYLYGDDEGPSYPVTPADLVSVSYIEQLYKSLLTSERRIIY